LAIINAVIDISHHNGPALDFAKAKGSGIIGVVHKATQGLSGLDPAYATNKAKALKAGLLWGAYHFGNGSTDGAAQADTFLNGIGNPKNTLMVLDFEPNLAGTTMTLAQARAFTAQVADKTGRWPGLYSGQLIKQLLGEKKDPILALSWLWLAQYGPKPVVPANWTRWTMWQYTDGAVGDPPHEVPGIGKCDRDKYNGSEAALRKLWKDD
jgi:lysozyme